MWDVVYWGLWWNLHIGRWLIVMGGGRGVVQVPRRNVWSVWLGILATFTRTIGVQYGRAVQGLPGLHGAVCITGSSIIADDGGKAIALVINIIALYCWCSVPIWRGSKLGLKTLISSHYSDIHTSLIWTNDCLQFCLLFACFSSGKFTPVNVINLSKIFGGWM